MGNLIALCTTQGVAVQQDSTGSNKLFHHSVDAHGNTNRHWLEAERSHHKVGQAQTETQAERDDALKRGKAVSSVIGIKALGTRFNVLMTVQIPLKQDRKPTPSFGGMGGNLMCFGSSLPLKSEAALLDLQSFSYSDNFASAAPLASAPLASAPSAPSMHQCSKTSTRRTSAGGQMRGRKKAGTSNAARVSRGDFVDVWHGLKKRSPVRHVSEHVTVTVVIFNTVAGGVPSLDDVRGAVDDLEALYAACSSGRLSSDAFDFVKKELTVQDVKTIHQKVTSDPPSNPVLNHTTFPTDTPTPTPVPPPLIVGSHVEANSGNLGTWHAGKVVKVDFDVGTKTQTYTIKYDSHKVGFSDTEHAIPSTHVRARPAPPVATPADRRLSSMRVGQEWSHLPVKHESYAYLHEQAVHWLDQGVSGGKLGDAYHHLVIADEMHRCVHGHPDPYSHYNIACCLSVMARDNALVLATLPLPYSNKDKLLDAAGKHLLMAVSLGYSNHSHMNSDPDLSALRGSRQTVFQRAVNIITL